MARLLQTIIPQIKKFAVYLGLNPEVATKNWPVRGTYRIAPASAPAPTFTHNFPLKENQIADLEFQDRAVRLTREAMDVSLVYTTTNPRSDARNIWNSSRTSSSNNLHTAAYIPSHDQVHVRQVSERAELSL